MHKKQEYLINKTKKNFDLMGKIVIALLNTIALKIAFPQEARTRKDIVVVGSQ